MSQREPSEQNYGSVHHSTRTERLFNERQDITRPQQTDRQLHGDSPTRHDVEFYVRKVNRYQVEIARLEHDLSVSKFKLSKAEDYEIKYDLLFKENQSTVTKFLDNRDELEKVKRDLDRAVLEQDNANQLIRSLRQEVQGEKRNNQKLRGKGEELRNKSTNEGQEERKALKESFDKELDSVKRENRDLQQKLKREIGELKGTIVMKESIEGALNTKLEHIKQEKNSEISRLKELVSSLRNQLGETHSNNQDKSIASRSQLINETEDRIGNVRRLGQLIEETLKEEIVNLNETMNKKNDEIKFLLQCDKRQLQSHESAENALRNLVAKLQDKIFIIQRENELQLYDTLARLKNQYDQNLRSANAEWDEIRLTHAAAVEALRNEINEQKSEIALLESQNRNIQTQHKQLASDQQHSVQMLSQRIIAMEIEKDSELKNYTTSMKQIEDDAKSKLDDLHKAIINKNSETDLLNAQIALKNGEISHLLQEISRLRDINRQKMKQLQSINAAEQNALNNEISAYKKQILQLKRNLHELENKNEDDEAEHQLGMGMLRQELQSQKEANELLNSRNAFLTEWCGELQRDLKSERVGNVNILHDTTMSKRENVQLRQEVRVELEALKNKEIQQIRNVHQLEKARLESELARREHELRDKKEELGRLLVQYKGLQAKVGKSSKLNRNAEEEGKCRATLQAEILLSENIFNAINRP